LKFCRRFLPLTDNYEGKNFFVRREGKTFATPLFVVLLVVETTDILFATDSIPAILAITRDPFIVYTSNVFAILGLRSLYFALAGMMKLFHYLNYGLSVVLMFIGAKMLLPERYHVPTWAALAVVAGVLGLSVLASVLFPKKDQPSSEAPQA
jgi:tellurite resistance protein TerC